MKHSRSIIKITTLAIFVLAFCLSCSKKTLSLEETQSEVKTDKPIYELPYLIDALNAYDSGLQRSAKKQFEEMANKYPGTFFSALIDLKMADIEFEKENYKESISHYQNFIEKHHDNEAKSYARFQIAIAHLLQYKGAKRDTRPLIEGIRSIENFEAYSEKNEYSLILSNLKKEAKEKLAENELRVANFYRKQNKDKAYASRLKQIIEEFPQTSSASKAKELLEKN